MQTKILLCILNDVYESGAIPTEWYDCKVVTVRMPKADSFSATTCRPICLLQCVRKLLEKIHKIGVVARKSEKVISHKIRLSKMHGNSKLSGFFIIDDICKVCSQLN